MPCITDQMPFIKDWLPLVKDQLRFKYYRNFQKNDMND